VLLRRYERRSGRKKRTYWALADSIRTRRGSRQRIVAYLGELAASEQSGWAQLGRSLSGKQRPQPSLFDPPHYDDPSNDEPVLVNLNGIRLQRLCLATCGWLWDCGGCWAWTRSCSMWRSRDAKRCLGRPTCDQERLVSARRSWPTTGMMMRTAGGQKVGHGPT